MFYIGCHLSSSKGFYAMAKEAVGIGANTFQFFTRNPRGSKAKELDTADIEKFLKFYDENGFGKIIAHAPYTINPCSNNESTREFALQTMADDIKRMEHIPGNYYNFHPGSHVGQGAEKGIELICETLNAILFDNMKTTVLLETMSGKGTEVGRSFEELKKIIDRVELNEKLGVCVDTCHIHDAGYDIVGNLEGVLDEFDSVIGLERLKAIHLNDSMNTVGSHKDRHAKIGFGEIGTKALAAVINSPRLSGIPFCLETPNDIDGYKCEIELLRGLYNGG
ncbi:MAG: deoxyribonuclease IV [Firmicutes bacterium]|nr:deoxyribonuclease IV [Bacillota bacterium]